MIILVQTYGKYTLLQLNYKINRTLTSSLCLISLYLVVWLFTPSRPAGNEITYFWNILQCFQLCSAYTKTKQINNRGLGDWIRNASHGQTGCSLSQSNNSWQKARQIENRLLKKLVFNSLTISFLNVLYLTNLYNLDSLLYVLSPFAENKGTLYYH